MCIRMSLKIRSGMNSKVYTVGRKAEAGSDRTHGCGCCQPPCCQDRVSGSLYVRRSLFWFTVSEGLVHFQLVLRQEHHGRRVWKSKAADLRVVKNQITGKEHQ